ncbi:helix-turn-helix domain-containing protein [Kribbella sp. NBC_01245]|uniref:helix-turn-helix domain-containing protein n=1 Tax=Kribbella sp. NBC_01245 TaxID=2903578 RepID=UPI002E2B150F|nr:helix-turn-helix domain-containing protein [Kribbella sp. NBC_01245]
MAAEFELRSRSASPALRPFVADLIGYAYPGEPPALHRGLPSQFLTVVISLDEPIGVSWPGAPVDKFDMLISGLHSQAVAIGESPNRSGIQLALTAAGSRALFGVPPGELGSIVVNLDALLGWPARQLADQLREIPSWDGRFDLIEGLLLKQEPGRIADGVRPEVGWAWRRLRETAGAVGVQDIASEVGWSRRHLTDRFRDEFGLAPKVAARVLRFERAVGRLKRRPRTKLADLAFEVGYADQAHLTREWHALAGCSPRQWIAEELPFVQENPADAEQAGRYEH